MKRQFQRNQAMKQNDVKRLEYEKEQEKKRKNKNAIVYKV